MPEHRQASAKHAPTSRLVLTQQDRDQMTQSNQTDSPLLRLPAEIRNKIYALAFSSATIHDLYYPSHRLLQQDSISLLRTCRQTYYESRCYSETFFSLATARIRFGAEMKLVIRMIGQRQSSVLEVLQVGKISGQGILKDRISREGNKSWDKMRLGSVVVSEVFPNLRLLEKYV